MEDKTLNKDSAKACEDLVKRENSKLICKHRATFSANGVKLIKRIKNIEQAKAIIIYLKHNRGGLKSNLQRIIDAKWESEDVYNDFVDMVKIVFGITIKKKLNEKKDAKSKKVRKNKATTTSDVKFTSCLVRNTVANERSKKKLKAKIEPPDIHSYIENAKMIRANRTEKQKERFDWEHRPRIIYTPMGGQNKKY